MATITVYGASDDLIEVEGDIDEEWDYQPDQDHAGTILAFSDGTLLRLTYTPAGVWRIARVQHGTASLEIEQAPEGDEDNYSDRATLTGDIDWVAHAMHWKGVR